MIYDVIVIGAGVIGCSVARELSRWNVKVLVIESASDVADGGCSKANTAIIHAGFDAEEGSNKAKYNVLGNSLYTDLCNELEVPFKRNGALVVAFDQHEVKKLEQLLERGRANNVPNLEIINQEKLQQLEPNLSTNVVAALYAPTSGSICPYELTVALAENAKENGAEFIFDTEVSSVCFKDNLWSITTKCNKEFVAKAVVNAAGYRSVEFNNMVSQNKLTLKTRRGEYYMVDKSYANSFTSTIFPLPTEKGKGILIAPTVDGTLLLGPTSIDTDTPSDTQTTIEGLESILAQVTKTWEKVPMRSIITTFAGVRPGVTAGDFQLGEVADAPMFFNCAGVESPGLASAPAIGAATAKNVAERLNAEINPSFNPTRKSIDKFRELSNEEREKLIAQNPSFGRIVCRCEMVTEGEIRQAINRSIPATNLDAIKRRTRAGMGRCQGGFCTPRIVEILCEELNLQPTDITKFGKNSHLLVGKIGRGEN